ncbi:Protein of unknown function (DUF4448) domain containing protein [Rhypophila decipiens]
MCDNLDGRNGLNAPFCSPSTNTAVQVGRTKKVTWDPRFFNRSSSSRANVVFIQADFGSTASDSSFGGRDGFTSAPLDPLSGSFTWTILNAFLTSGGRETTSRGARLFLATQEELIGQNQIVDPDTGTPSVVTRITGPRVVIRASSSSRDNNNRMDMPNPLSIALPVGLGALVVLIIGVWFGFRRWRNHSSAAAAAQNKDQNSRGHGKMQDLEMKQSTPKTVGGQNKPGFWKKLGLGRPSSGPGSGYGSKSTADQRTETAPPAFRFGFGSKKSKAKGQEEIEIVHSTHMNAGGGVRPARMGFVGGKLTNIGGGGGLGGSNTSNNVFRDEVRRQEDRGGQNWRDSDYL